MNNKLLAMQQLLRVVCVLALMLPASVALASTILQLDVDALLEQAELVFEGEVIESSAFEKDANGAVHTRVVFRIDEIIAGAHSGSKLTLEFAGGQVHGKGMRVSGSILPAQGERGIYFVESISRGLVNPLLGWSQGHFTLTRDSAGKERVLTNRSRPVKGIALPPQARDLRAPFSNGVARGVRTGSAGEAAAAGMQSAEFKRQLRERLREKAAQRNMRNPH
ncbi:MAG: hypothetical protein HKO84_09620 [Pseudomonadales bacterium]|nr:hypothetical protein [Pseudomonadales bacterium]